MLTVAKRSPSIKKISPTYNWPLIGALPSLLKDPLQFLIELGALGKPIVLFKLGPSPACFVNCPSLLQTVLIKKSNVFGTSPLYDKMAPVIGDGLTLTRDPRLWQRKRNLLQRQFDPESLRSYCTVFRATALAMTARWEEIALLRGTIDIEKEMLRLTLENLVRTIFSADFEPSMVTEDFTTVSSVIARRFWSVFPGSEYFPTRENYSFKRAMTRLNNVVMEIIDRKRRMVDSDGSMIATLIRAEDSEGYRFTDSEIRDEVMTFLMAGHDTTASLLSWAFVVLAQRQELSNAFEEDFTAIGSEYFTGLNEMKNLEMFLNEVLRMYCPAWIMSRRVNQPTELGGVALQKGATVLISPFVLHRNAQYWPTPGVFDPSRFTPEGIKERHPAAFCPFGLGARRCIGYRFSMLEALATLSIVVSRFRFSVDSPRPIGFDARVALYPAKGTHLRPEFLKKCKV